MEERIEALVEGLTLEEKVMLCSGVDTWASAPVPRLGIGSVVTTDGPNGARGGDLAARTTAASFPVGTALGATWDVDLVGRVAGAIAEEARTKGAHVLLGPTLNLHRSPLAGRNFECFSEDPELAARLAVAYVAGVQAEGVAACAKHLVCNDAEFERHEASSDVEDRPLRELYLRPFEPAVDAGVWTVMSAYNRINGTHAASSRWLLTDLLKDEWGFDGLVMSDWHGTYDTVGPARAGLDLEMPGPPQHWGPKLLDAVRSGAVDETTIDDKVRRLLRLAVRTGAIDETERRTAVAVDDPGHRALAREAASSSMVLLKNTDALVPVDVATISKVAIIGPNAERGQIQGGGSSAVFPHRISSPLDALTARFGDDVVVFHEPGCDARRYVPHLRSRQLRPLPGNLSPGDAVTRGWYLGAEPTGEPVTVERGPRLSFTAHRVPTKVIDALAARGDHDDGDGDGAGDREVSVRSEAMVVADVDGRHTVGLASVGPSRLFVDGELVCDNWSAPVPGPTFFSNGTTEVRGTVDLEAGEARHLVVEQQVERASLMGLRVGLAPPGPTDLLDRAVGAAHEADLAIVVVGLDPDWETEGSDRVSLSLPHPQDELIERVAAVSDRTIVVVNAGSPVRMDWVDQVDAVLMAWYPGQELGEALADVLCGDVDPGGRLPTTFPVRPEDAPTFPGWPGENHRILYGEGVHIGYRYYDAKDVAPLFCFGHGLSTTSFELGGLEVSEVAAATFDVSVTVTNTGGRRGREVVQVYVADVESTLQRPVKELGGFVKVELEPAASERVTVRLGPRAFSAWDPAGSRWWLEPGEFEILVGVSSRDIRARETLTVDPGEG
ncbi:MAG: glycoside hydrolase family 3 C-terminal domain-containing protein [Actinomycetota bacterium]|nr:glycoside hydrolase family 3 C-terminal domain-containing protein [Actinomycetota bacterium]